MPKNTKPTSQRKIYQLTKNNHQKELTSVLKNLITGKLYLVGSLLPYQDPTSGEHALIVAAKNGNLELCNTLIKIIEFIEEKKQNRERVKPKTLDYDAKKKEFIMPKSGNPDLEKIDSTKYCDKHGFSALTWAVKTVNIDLVKLMLKPREGKLNQLYFDPNIEDKNGERLLELITKSMGDDNNQEYIQIALELIKAGASIKEPAIKIELESNIDIQDKGVKALLQATNNQDHPSVKKLLNAGAYENAYDEKDGKTILMIATENNDLEMVKTIMSTKPNLETVLFYYNQIDNLPEEDLADKTQWTLLLIKRNQIQAELDVCTTPARTFILKSELSEINTMIDESLSDFDINFRCFTPDHVQNRYNGYTALMFAAENGYIDIVTELLKHPRIDPELTCFTSLPGNTAATKAEQKGHHEIAKMIKSHDSPSLRHGK
ncbi:MAG TPA: ankyrin repeat domain-containing protein [Gammaproteobacteria bacterium]|nr:ankyrin repeat domain-containing protein [Gammaproteobacteria bacterium]